MEIKTACFTGHRPKFFNGEYDIQSDFYKPFIKYLTESIKEKIKCGVNNFITGGALGIDTIAFFCVHKMKAEYPDIKNILALPFEAQGSNWSIKDKQWLDMMKKLADKVVMVDEIDEYKVGKKKVYHPKKLQRRNEYMVDKSDDMIAIWNGEPSGTKNCISYGLTNNIKIKYIYVQRGDNNMKITKTDFTKEFQEQMAEMVSAYKSKVSGEPVEVAKTISNIINIFDETGIAKIEFDESSPLDKVLKDTYTVTNIDEENNAVSFKEIDGESSVLVTI